MYDNSSDKKHVQSDLRKDPPRSDIQDDGRQEEEYRRAVADALATPEFGGSSTPAGGDGGDGARMNNPPLDPKKWLLVNHKVSGESFGDVGTAKHQPRNATVRAEERTWLLAVDVRQADFRELVVGP